MARFSALLIEKLFQFNYYSNNSHKFIKIIIKLELILHFLLISEFVVPSKVTIWRKVQRNHNVFVILLMKWNEWKGYNAHWWSSRRCKVWSIGWMTCEHSKVHIKKLQKWNDPVGNLQVIHSLYHVGFLHTTNHMLTVSIKVVVEFQIARKHKLPLKSAWKISQTILTKKVMDFICEMSVNPCKMTRYLPRILHLYHNSLIYLFFSLSLRLS